MSRDVDFLARWAAEEPVYAAWGTMISEKVRDRIGERIKPISPEYFLKTAVAPRTKEGMKLVEKAFYREKNYADPYSDITDKVGTRFVVLLGSDVRLVEEVLVSFEDWTFSKDRDYEEEQKDNPVKFDYAAVHYVVRPKTDVEFGEARIPEGTPCEVQIKTLLQHAYSELTHDTIYKPQIQATHTMQRNAAKAMALLEATNDYFEKVSEDVNIILSSVRKVTSDLSSLYRELVGFEPKPTALEGILLNAYENTAADDYLREVQALLADKSFIARNIRERVSNGNPIFAQPSVLLAYLAVHSSPRRAKRDWPLTPVEMEALLNDLGESNN